MTWSSSSSFAVRPTSRASFSIVPRPPYDMARVCSAIARRGVELGAAAPSRLAFRGVVSCELSLVPRHLASYPSAHLKSSRVGSW